MTSPVRPLRSRLLLPETLPFSDARERRWFYNYRGAGGPWTPANLSGLAFWGSGDSATVDGSNNLTAWPSFIGSISGAPGTAAPTVVTVSGKRWLRFNGTSQFVTLDALAALLGGTDTPYTVAFSLKLASTATTMVYWSAGSSASSSPYDWRGASGTGVWTHQRRDDAISASPIINGTAPTNTAAHVVVDTFNGVASSHYVNNVPDWENLPCDLGALTLDRAAIGCRRRTTNDFFLGADMRQAVLVPGRAVSAAERGQLTAYLAADAGVTLP